MFCGSVGGVLLSPYCLRVLPVPWGEEEEDEKEVVGGGGGDPRGARLPERQSSRRGWGLEEVECAADPFSCSLSLCEVKGAEIPLREDFVKG